MGNQATIEDVGRAAGVSRQTVSRVINRSPNVSTKARTKVEEAIGELGYVPNLAARRMGGSRSFTLLALIQRGALDQLPLGEMLAAGLDACREHGYHLIFEQVDPPKGRQAKAKVIQQISPVLGAVQPDGAIVMPPLDQSAPVLKALDALGVRASCLADQTGFGRTAPGLDESDFAEAATQQLVDLGHKQIAFVPSAAMSERSARRLEGYRRTLAKVKSRAPRHFVAPAAFDDEALIDLAKQWLTPTIRPTAIIAENAHAALIIAKEAKKLKRSIPHDLSILALENSAELAKNKPPISAMHIPYGTLFAQTCERLIDPATAAEAGGLDAAFEFVDRDSLAQVPAQ